MPSAKLALPERTWWIEKDRLLGGAYPGDLDPLVARKKLEALLDLGIRTFVNLMETHASNHAEMAFEPYAPIADSIARQRSIELEHERFPIVDQSIPSVDEMRAIQACIDERLASGRLCFVHCWGGRGRTGTVAGVYLIRRGLATTADFVDVILDLRGSDADRGPAPENSQQRDFVRRYPFSGP